LLAQIFAIIALLVYFQMSQGLSTNLAQIGPIWVLAPLLAIWGVLWINLFNFMDGIDGLAATEAVFVLASMVLLASGSPFWEMAGPWLWLICIAGTGLVFLFFNWSPAKIFMGDVGSYFFAIAIFLGAIWGLLLEQLSPSASFILIAMFVAVTGVTLGRRIITGENWTSGHRTHAYQYLSRRTSHAKATAIYLGVNLVWLFPLAFCAQNSLLNPNLCVLIAYTPLIVLMVWGKAGQPETSRHETRQSDRA